MIYVYNPDGTYSHVLTVKKICEKCSSDRGQIKKLLQDAPVIKYKNVIYSIFKKASVVLPKKGVYRMGRRGGGSVMRVRAECDGVKTLYPSIRIAAMMRGVDPKDVLKSICKKVKVEGVRYFYE